MSNSNSRIRGNSIVLLCVTNGEAKPYGVEDDCNQCEFCMTSDAGGTFGGQIGSRGTFQYCEKGYWKEDT